MLNVLAQAAAIHAVMHDGFLRTLTAAGLGLKQHHIFFNYSKKHGSSGMDARNPQNSCVLAKLCRHLVVQLEVPN